MKKIIFNSILLTILGISNYSFAQTSLLKNINVESTAPNELSFADVNGTLFFVKEIKPYLVYELWKSDGTEVGTVLVKDNFNFDPKVFYYWRSANSFPKRNLFEVVNNTLFFVAADTVNVDNYELWKTDGTTAGTLRVKDIYSGTYSSNPELLTNVNGTLFFRATGTGTMTGNPALWKSDGTESGTVLVKDIYPSGLVNFNSTLLFMADEGINGRELWKSDGTTSGTVLLKNINLSGSSTTATDPDGIVVNNSYYFGANNGISGTELWKSDGTTAGTTLVKDINAGSAASNPYSFVKINSTVYFLSNINSQLNIFKSDGTDAGTILVSGANYHSDLTVVNDDLFYITGDNGFKLWKINNTTNQTIQLANINFSPRAIDSFRSLHLTALGNNLYFANYTSTSGSELWKSDGTVAGTAILKDIYVGYDNAYPTNLIVSNNKLFFGAYDGGRQSLWKSDGTQLGTTKVKEGVFSRTDVGSNLEYVYNNYRPEYLTNVNGTVFFAPYHGSFGVELWKTDGTPSGTVLVKDINNLGHNKSSFPRRFCNVNGILYFSADDGINGEELWKSDGTEAGTIMVKDIFPGINPSTGANSSRPNYITNANGAIFFIATNSTNGRELWKSDGTSEGTVLVKDIYPSTSFNDETIPRHLVNFNGTLYFSADDNVSGRELWKSDGTFSGTNKVIDIYTGYIGGISANSNILVTNNSIFFQADNDENKGWELWKSDGTAAGTFRLKDINLGSGNGVEPSTKMIDVNGIIYFKGIENGFGAELWKTDGTTNGTVRVNPSQTIGSSEAGPIYFTNVNGTIYYLDVKYINSSLSYGLWKTDGTAAGTSRVKDFGNRPLGLLSKFGNNIYFGGGNNELWKSDGTEVGTIMEKKIKIAIGNYNGYDDPYTDAEGIGRKLLEVNDRLFYYGDDEIYGSELWSTFVSPCPTLLSLQSTTNDYSNTSTEPNSILIKQASATNGSITATNKITSTAKVIYQAKSISLGNGFKADNGTVFLAEMGGCNN